MAKKYICDFCGSYWVPGRRKFRGVCALCGAGSKIVMGSQDDYRRANSEKAEVEIHGGSRGAGQQGLRS